MHVDLVYDTYFGTETNVTKMGPPTPEAKFIAKLDMILPLRHRIRYLSLTLSTSALTSTSLTSHLASVAPCKTLLEGFRFRQTEFWRPWEEKRIVDAEVFVFSKFRSDHLREIYFDGVVIPRDHYTVASLTHLAVPLTSANMVSEELESTFCGCVHLVSLSLGLQKVRTFTTKTKLSIPLPKLRQLSMKGNSHILSLIYGSFDAPSVEEVDLETEYSHSDPVGLFLPSQPVGCLHITVNEPNVCLNFTEPTHFSLSLASLFMKGNALADYNVLTRLLGSHRYKQIISLDFITSSHFNSTFMHRLLVHFPALTSLRISFVNDTSDQDAEPPTLLVKDAIDLDLLRSPTSPLRSLRTLLFRNLAVVLPQSSKFLLDLSNAVEWRRVRPELASLVVKFEDCQGVTDALLEVCGLKFD